MRLAPEQIKILESATEDYTDLYFAVEEVEEISPTSDYPSMSQVQRARTAVQGLLAEGLISLFQGEDFVGEEVEIPVSERESVLSDPVNWDWKRYQEERPKKAPRVCFISTRKGEDVYYHDPQVQTYLENKIMPLKTKAVA